MGILEESIVEKYNYNEFKRRIGEVGYSYNQTEGFWDVLESFFQKADWDGALDFMFYKHHGDVREHVAKYKNRILQGHKVLVVAHSQGNLYALDTYEKLGEESKDGWMQDYFEAVSIASPMTQDIKTGTPRIDWDNDLMPRMASLGLTKSWMIPNDVRAILWLGVILPDIFDERPDRYAYEHSLGKTYSSDHFDFIATEGGIDFPAKVHAFEFYMGGALLKKTIIIDGKTTKIYYQDPFDNKLLIDASARPEIMKAIDNQLVTLEKLPSQWDTKKRLGCTCKEKRIHISHHHDDSLDYLIYGGYIDYAVDDRPNHPFEFSIILLSSVVMEKYIV